MNIRVSLKLAGLDQLWLAPPVWLQSPNNPAVPGKGVAMLATRIRRLQDQWGPDQETDHHKDRDEEHAWTKYQSKVAASHSNPKTMAKTLITGAAFATPSKPCEPRIQAHL